MDYTDRLMEEFVDKFEDLKDEILGQKEDSETRLTDSLCDILLYKYAIARYKAYLWEAYESAQAYGDQSERATLFNTHKRDIDKFHKTLDRLIERRK